MVRRWVLAFVLAACLPLAAACGSTGPAYLKVTVTCDDPLVDLTLVDALTVQWTVDGVTPSVDVPVGDVLRDGATSFVLQMPGGVTVTALAASGTGPGGAVLATATTADVVVPRSGTREVTLALAPPAGPRPTTCAGGGAPALGAIVRVTDAPEHSVASSVAWMDTGWAVSFEDARYNDPTNAYKDPFIALLAPDGTKLGDEVRADDGWCYAAGSQVVWTGTRLALVWYSCAPSTDGNNYDLLFRTFDASGAPLMDTKQLTQAVAGNENWRTGSLLWAGGRLVLSASRLIGNGPSWDQFIYTYTEDGELADEPVLSGQGIAQAFDGGPKLASSGDGFAMVYDETVSGQPRARALILSPSAHAAGNPIDLGASQGASVAWAGDRYVVAQGDPTGPTPQIRLTPLGTDGSVGAPLILADRIGGSSGVPLASTGSDLGLAYNPNTTLPRVALAFQSAAVWLEPLGAPDVIPNDPAITYTVALGAGPAGYGLAWSDDTYGNWEVFFAAVACPE